MTAGRLHYVWDYDRNTGICWCGEDHADDSGNHGPVPDDQWTPISDPAAQEALDHLFLEAWLGDDRA